MRVSTLCFGFGLESAAPARVGMASCEAAGEVGCFDVSEQEVDEGPTGGCCCCCCWRGGDPDLGTACFGGLGGDGGFLELLVRCLGAVAEMRERAGGGGNRCDDG